MKVYRSEADLIDAAKTDPDAFGMLYETYVDRIYRYIYFHTGSDHDSEDITSKVFFKALNNIGKYQHMGVPFSAWLYRIAHNQVANYHRDRSRVREISIENLPMPNLLSKQDAPELSVEKMQKTAYLMRIINDLPRQKRELISLKIVEKLSNAEIGLIMKKSESAIKSLYHRTILELRDRLESELGDTELFKEDVRK